jgi:hypothetical protein
MKMKRYGLALWMSLAACTTVVQEANPTKGEAVKNYSFVSQCSKWMECDPQGLLAAHPGGIQGCVDDDYEQVTRILGADAMVQEGPCARTKLRQCANDYAGAACPSAAEIKAGEYLPHSPDPSCSACGWHE